MKINLHEILTFIKDFALCFVIAIAYVLLVIYLNGLFH